MTTKIALYTLVNESSEPEFEGPMGCCKGDICGDLRLYLESTGVFEWPFQVWNNDQKSQIKMKLERLNPIGDKVYVVQMSDGGEDTRVDTGKCTFDKAFGQSGGVGSRGGLVVDEISLPDSEPDAFPPLRSSQVSAEDSDIPKFDLKFVLVPEEAMEKYKSGHARLKQELQLISLDDFIWSLKSFDVNSVGVVELHCGECMKDIEGSIGDHNKNIIHNLFANFKNSHIMVNAHICNWC